MSRSRVIVWIGLFLWSAFVTIFLYGQSLQLPLFFDDLAWMPYVEETSLSQIWQSFGGFTYYRPLATSIWRLVYVLLDQQQSAFAYHSLNLILHALNGFLVGYLAYQLWSRPDQVTPERRFGATPWRSFLSATLFLIYPFSYQAVPWIGALFHILATTLIVGSVLSYWFYRESGKTTWLVIGLVLALFALFTHENGLMVGPLVLALEVTRSGGDRQQIVAGLRKALLWLTPLLIWFPIWLLVPRPGGRRLLLNGGETLLQNSAYFMQGIAYPVTWLGQKLRLIWEWNDMATALGFSILGLLLPLLIFVMDSRRSADASERNRRLLIYSYPFIWCLLLVLPSILLLKFDYVISGPRLLMLASVGAAWLWANAIICLLDMAAATVRVRRRTGVALGFTAVFLTLLILAQNLTFLRSQNQLYRLLDSAFDQARDLTIAANSRGRTAVFINFPNWAANSEFSFPLGHEGVMFKPDYLADDKVVSEQVNHPVKIQFMYYADIKPQMPYLYSLLGKGESWQDVLAASEPAAIYATQFFSDHVEIEPVGGTGFSAAGEQSPPLAQFELQGNDQVNPPVVLQSAELTAVSEALRLDLVWQIQTPPAHDVTVFVHVLGRDGELLNQADGAPWARTYPFGEWEEGAVIQDIRLLAWDRTRADSVQVGLYSNATGERLAVSTDEGLSSANNSVSLPIRNQDLAPVER